ncbi:MAG: NAD(+)/NADH kinase [Chromatiales bacterium]|jgi:NAD+ kinase|nr:NAD(+)/NADH kinase [Chromatiales bacterium]
MPANPRPRTAFRRIGVTGNPKDRRVMAGVAQLCAHLLARGLTVYAAAGPRLPDGVRRLDEPGFAARCDLVIAVGGDGSMLYAARRIARYRVPVLGINRGRLGFLADVAQDEMLARVDDILDGHYRSEERLLLDAVLVEGRRRVASGIALNDVVVKRHATGRMLEYETLVDGRYVNTHLGDGFIVATPTGSTAYALSCGGPIVEPGLDALVLTPICPHTLSDRPLLIPATRTVEVRLRDTTPTSPGEPRRPVPAGERAEVSVDGETVGRLGPGFSVRIRAARQRVTLVHPLDHDYFGVLRSKLRWGRDGSDGGPAAG